MHPPPNKGILLQATKQAAGELEKMREDIASVWQKVTSQMGGSLVGKHFVPFGKAGDMGDAIMTNIIYQKKAMLKSTKQRVLMNLNHIDTVIEMEISDTTNFRNVYAP
jgi:hypothetical protein